MEDSVNPLFMKVVVLIILCYIILKGSMNTFFLANITLGICHNIVMLLYKLCFIEGGKVILLLTSCISMRPSSL